MVVLKLCNRARGAGVASALTRARSSMPSASGTLGCTEHTPRKARRAIGYHLCPDIPRFLVLIVAAAHSAAAQLVCFRPVFACKRMCLKK